METQDKPVKIQQTLEDVGTRYQHLNDHYESLEGVISALSARASLSPGEKNALIRLRNAADICKGTIDGYVGIDGPGVEFQLYRMISSIPKDPESIEGGRGTELC